MNSTLVYIAESTSNLRRGRGERRLEVECMGRILDVWVTRIEELLSHVGSEI